VRDDNGQALAYVYFEDEPGRRSAAKLLNRLSVKQNRNNIISIGCATLPRFPVNQWIFDPAL
jgi:hypothetical protein